MLHCMLLGELQSTVQRYFVFTMTLVIVLENHPSISFCGKKDNNLNNDAIHIHVLYIMFDVGIWASVMKIHVT